MLNFLTRFPRRDTLRDLVDLAVARRRARRTAALMDLHGPHETHAPYHAPAPRRPLQGLLVPLGD
ncbi:hypothetical protein [Mitsuaria sp. GD03876]|uniref:hypothetical protein n=1 Tax=Mitsuaria sp. GD03876 TaxID=2975399 RepID=UPI00244ABDD3|nr:hypothetical protein [Mitsuaria sp. GD03876]MDH0864056.1 hypothetical protein [Mitsuaria sp. GD03876]